jgi:predicted TIM-barrel fold metal-dependent hydrolase
MALYDGPLVDAHHHLWSLTTGRYPWLQDERRERMVFGPTAKLLRDYLLDDYLADAAGSSLAMSIHVEAGHDRAAPLAETAWLQAIADARGFPHGLVAWAPMGTPDFPRVLARQARFRNLRGIRAVAAWHEDPALSFAADPHLLDDPRFVRDAAALAEAGLSLDLLVYPAQLPAVARLARALPALTVILDHAGSPLDRRAQGMADWRDGLANVATAGNTAIKLSDLAAYDHHWTEASLAPVVGAILACFGARRCLFGSDFPVAGLHGSFAAHYGAMRRLLADLSAAEQRAIFHDNAARVYRLAPSGAVARFAPRSA